MGIIKAIPEAIFKNLKLYRAKRKIRTAVIIM